MVVFRFGLGEEALGLLPVPADRGLDPIFLFAMLFGLSMDYEVFLVTPDAGGVGRDARRRARGGVGLERTGRIVTAAAVIMVAAFSGFLAGSIVGLQDRCGGCCVPGSSTYCSAIRATFDRVLTDGAFASGCLPLGERWADGVDDVIPPLRRPMARRPPWCPRRYRFMPTAAPQRLRADGRTPTPTSSNTSTCGR